MRTSVILQRARMAAALYKSSCPVISLVRLEVTMMTSSASDDSSLMPRYTMRRSTTSRDWKSLVIAKNTSVASVDPNCSPCKIHSKIIIPSPYNNVKLDKGHMIRGTKSTNISQSEILFVS